MRYTMEINALTWQSLISRGSVAVPVISPPQRGPIQGTPLVASSGAGSSAGGLGRSYSMDRAPP